ncbi:MAG: hypothetical protein ACKO96_38890 [Flammeovirgaceae bacterium]
MLLDLFPTGLGFNQTDQSKKAKLVFSDGKNASISCASSSSWALGKPEEVVEVAEEKEEENNSSRRSLYFGTIVPSITKIQIAFSYLTSASIPDRSTLCHLAKSYLFLKVFRI